MRISQLFLILGFFATFSVNAMEKQDKPKKTAKNNEKDEKLEREILDAAIKEGVEALKAGRLKELDPTVGDWGCHERAPEVIRLYRLYKSSGSIPDASLEFIGISQLLTKAKKRTQMADLLSPVHESTDRRRISPFLSHDKGDIFIKKCQSKIAQMTVKLMQQQAKEIGDAQLLSALDIVKSDETRFDRKHCPFYPGVKTVLKYALKNEIPLVVKISRYDEQGVHRFHAYFKSKNKGFTAANLTDFDDSQAILVFEGTSSTVKPKAKHNQTQSDVKHVRELEDCDTNQFIEKFKKLDIYEIILINAALHQQFVGKQHQTTQIPFDKHNLQALQAEMQQYKEKGQEGFTRNSVGGPYVFIVDHVFPTTIKEFKNDQGVFEFLEQNLKLPEKVCDIINAGIHIP